MQLSTPSPLLSFGNERRVFGAQELRAGFRQCGSSPPAPSSTGVERGFKRACLLRYPLLLGHRSEDTIEAISELEEADVVDFVGEFLAEIGMGDAD